MYLKPSEIFFSQDSINNVFDKNCGHRYKPIGETLDALCNGSCSIGSIPTISVVKQNNKWFTADNRRLWVFRNLERLGKCNEIYVKVGSYIPSSKFTTYNEGASVIVRNGSPGGYWHKKQSVNKQPVSKAAIVDTSKLPVYVREENKENLGPKPSSVDYSFRPSNEPKLRPIDNMASNIHDDPGTSTSKIEFRAPDFIVTVSEDAVHKTEEDNTVTWSVDMQNKSIQDEKQAPMVPAAVIIEDSAVKGESCRVQVDEDNNEVLTTDSRAISVTSCTNRTAGKIDTRCIIAIVSGVVIAVVVLIVIVVFSLR